MANIPQGCSVFDLDSCWLLMVPMSHHHRLQFLACYRVWVGQKISTMELLLLRHVVPFLHQKMGKKEKHGQEAEEQTPVHHN